MVLCGINRIFSLQQWSISLKAPIPNIIRLTAFSRQSLSVSLK